MYVQPRCSKSRAQWSVELRLIYLYGDQNVSRPGNEVALFLGGSFRVEHGARGVVGLPSYPHQMR